MARHVATAHSICQGKAVDLPGNANKMLAWIVYELGMDCVQLGFANVSKR
jgi:hypothetical protein